MLLAIASTSLLGCTYAEGSLFPAKYEQIRDADAIVLARLDAKKESSVDFTIVELLKGDFPEPVLSAQEANNSCYSLSFDFENHRYLEPRLSEKLAERAKRPVFYVLFLSKTHGLWSLDQPTTAALSEKIVNADESASLTAIRHFVRIGLKNNYELEKAELIKLRLLARSARNSKLYPAELVGMVDDYLTSPAPSRSFADLRDLYYRLPKEKRVSALWAMAWGKHPQAERFILHLLKSSIPSTYLGPISKYIEETKNESLMARLGRNYPDIGNNDRWPVMWAMIRTADASHMNMMLTALRSSNYEGVERLSEWFVRFPNTEATEIVRRHVNGDFEASFELSSSLAGLGDKATLEWAREFMNSNSRHRWMAYMVIAHSPLEEADILAKRVIESSDPKDLSFLIQEYASSKNPNRWDRLRDITRLSNRDKRVDTSLRHTLKKMASKGDSEAGEILRSIE